MRYKEEEMAHLTTREYWQNEEALENLSVGWRACLARRLEKEEAEVNNRIYRQGEAGK